MPQRVPLQAIPNQSFSITLDNNIFQIVLKSTNGVVSMSVSINGTQEISNMHVAACQPVIPSHYEEAGNFVFLTANHELPNYAQFNVTQSLFYFSQAELDAFRAPPALPVTSEYFNPIAQLPLRFSPQGYVGVA